MRVCLGNINPGEVSAAFCTSILAARDARVIDGHILHTSGPYLDDARNRVVRGFLDNTDMDALIFVDSDIEFVPDDIARLVKCAEFTNSIDIVAGWYASMGTDGMIPVVYRWVLDSEGARVPHDIDPDELIAAPSDAELIQVDSIGTGFMLIRRELFLAVEQHTCPALPFFTEPVVDGVHLGEDHGFCMRATDPRVGGRVFVNPHVRVRHHKKVKL